MTRATAWIVVSGLLLAAVTAWADVEVDTCGQSVDGRAFLAADLDCTGYPADAVLLGPGAKFDLRGFTLTGGNANGIRCGNDCEVTSDPPGGRIQGSLGDGVYLSSKTSMRLQGIVVTGNTGGVDCDVSTSIYPPFCFSVLEDTTVTGNGEGVSGQRISVLGSTITNNGFGILGTAGINVVDSTITDNHGHGVYGQLPSQLLLKSIVVQRSTVSNNDGNGVYTIADAAIKLLDSYVVANTGDGVRGLSRTSAQLQRSTVTGNGGNGVSIVDSGVSVRESVITENVVDGVVVQSGGYGRVKFSRSIASGNGGRGVTCLALECAKTTVVGSTIESNAIGVETTGAAKLSRSRVADNAQDGVHSTRLTRSVGSMVVGNATDAACGASEECADLHTGERPNVRLVPGVSECGTSHVLGSGIPGATWGVCLND